MIHRGRVRLLLGPVADINRPKFGRARPTPGPCLLVSFAEMKQYEPEEKFTQAVKSRVFYDSKVIRPEQLVVFGAKPKVGG